MFVDRAGPDVTVSRAAPVESCGPGDNMVFADAEAYLGPILERKPAAVVTTPDFAERLPGLAVVTAKNVRLAQACILERYFDRDVRNEGWPRVHPSAVVHDTASVPPSVTIGPNAVVGAGARLGERSVPRAHHRARRLGGRGDRHPPRRGHRLRVRDRQRRASSGRARSSVRRGSASRRTRSAASPPHSPARASGDRGPRRDRRHCCLDRGTHGATRIGAGTVMDNLCHIAHNVRSARTAS